LLEWKELRLLEWRELRLLEWREFRVECFVKKEELRLRRKTCILLHAFCNGFR
jgi:hypothetical protein